MKAKEEARLFMEPRSIAIVGVSRHSGEEHFNLLENLLHYGFGGKLYPVNPAAKQILGIKSYPSLSAVPEEIDLVVIAIPRSIVPGAVAECARKGVKAVIIFAQGFADADEEGKRLQAEIVEIAKRAGMRIMGPNTFGVANAYFNLNTSFGQMKMEKTPIGVISQSGIFFIGLSQFNFGKAIDIGNACDVDIADALEYFEDDPDIKVIALHIEGIRRGRRFIDIASRVRKKKPIIALKTGRTEHGAKAAQSHTGSLGGKDEAYEAVCRQCGIIRVGDAEELEDVASALWRLPPIKGKRVAIMSWAGSTAVMAADACHKYGLELAKLSPDTLARIQQLAPPPWLPINNPVDIWACIGLNGFRATDFKAGIKTILESLLMEGNADSVLIIVPDFLTLFDSPHWDMSSVLEDAVSVFKDKPVAVSIFGPQGELTARIRKIRKVAVFPSSERGVRALARAREYTQ